MKLTNLLIKSKTKKSYGTVFLDFFKIVPSKALKKFETKLDQLVQKKCKITKITISNNVFYAIVRDKKRKYTTVESFVLEYSEKYNAIVEILTDGNFSVKINFEI